MRIKKILKRPIYFALAAAALAVAGCSKSEPMIAIVNGESITEGDFHKYMELKPQVQVIVNPAALQAGTGGQLPTQPYNGQVVGSLALQSLNDLVQQTLLRQLAKDEGVWPTDAEIQEEITDKTKESPNWLKELTNNGFTTDMIRRDVALQLAQYKLTTRGINVTEQEVDDYIKERPQEFVVPESADLTWILVPDEKTKKAADADLKAGNTFILVAQRYSIAPNARANGYRFPEQYIPNMNRFGPELMPAIKKAGEQQQTDWIRFTEGWAKFYVNKKNKERKLQIDAAMRKKVKRLLAVQRGSQGKDVNQRVQDKLRTAKVEIVTPFLREPWKRSMESLQAQRQVDEMADKKTSEGGTNP